MQRLAVMRFFLPWTLVLVSFGVGDRRARSWRRGRLVVGGSSQGRSGPARAGAADYGSTDCHEGGCFYTPDCIAAPWPIKV